MILFREHSPADAGLVRHQHEREAVILQFAQRVCRAGQQAELHGVMQVGHVLDDGAVAVEKNRGTQRLHRAAPDVCRASWRGTRRTGFAAKSCSAAARDSCVPTSRCNPSHVQPRMRPTNAGSTSNPRSNLFMSAASRYASAVITYRPALARLLLGFSGFSTNSVTR